jgi:four helix bundle protein
MSRDPRKLRTFVLADGLIAEVYRVSSMFPVSERFGLQSQLRRAALSTATNIVEGSARRSTQEYLYFINVAAASASEARYLVQVAHRLEFVTEQDRERLSTSYREVAGGLHAVLNALSPKP